MRAEVSGDELLVTLDTCELPDKASERVLAARLPCSAHEIAAEVVRILDKPKGAGVPVTVRSVTVRIVRTEVIATETLMFSEATEIYA